MSKTKNKDTIVGFRVDPSQRKKLTQAAKKAGITPSRLVRNVLFGTEENKGAIA